MSDELNNLSELDHLSIELFVKSDEGVDNKELTVQEGGAKKKKKKRQIILTESITSIENLSETSESEDSKYMIQEIADKLKSDLKDIN
jgi:hypothetical protein